MHSSVVLYSGGFDSFVLLEYVRRVIDPATKPIYFDIKGRYTGLERNYTQSIDPYVEIDDTLILGDMEAPSAYIPNRNIILTTLAASRYSNKVFIGGSKSDRISDNNKECFDTLSDFLSKINQKNIQITSPFWDVYKEDMANWYCSNVPNGPENLLYSTFSCYNPLSSPRVTVVKHKDGSDIQYNNSHCLECPACFRRNSVLSSVGYVIPFFDYGIITKYQNEFLSKVSLDSTDKRAVGTLSYLEELKRLYAKD